MRRKLGIVFFIIVLIICLVCLGIASLMYTNQSQITVHQLPLQRKWAFEIKEQIRTTPIIYDNKVFIVDGQELYSIDALTGNPVWSITLPDVVTANPVIHDKIIIVSFLKGARAFDLKTGKQLWEQNRDSAYPYRPAAANDKYVVFLSYSAMVHDIKTGEFLWRAGKSYPEPLAVAVTLDDRNLYIIFENQIHSYDVESGQLLWQNFTEDEWSLYTGFLAEDVFYLKRKEEGIAAYELEQHKILWSRDDLNLSRYPISRQDQTLYLGTSGNAPVAIDAQTGQTMWVAKELNSLDSYQTPLIIENIVYIRGLFLKRIYALDKFTGKLIGYINLGVPDIVSASAEHSLGPVQYNDWIIFPVGNKLLAYGK